MASVLGRCGVVVAACGIAATGALATGCGASEEGAAVERRSEYSWANEPPKTFVERLAKLLETSRRGDCAQLNSVSARSTTTFDCPPDRALARSMARFRPLGSEEHGTGAVVEYRSGAVTDSAAIVLTVAPDRGWAVSHFGLYTDQSVGTSDKRSREGYERTVRDYLEAVRDRDCKGLARLDFQPSGASKPSCKERLTATRGLAKSLRADPGAEPVYQGGNATFGFHTVETRKPKLQNVTIATLREQPADAQSAARAGEDKGGRASRNRASYVVLGAVPSPTSADQRKAIQAIDRSERQRRR